MQNTYMAVMVKRPVKKGIVQKKKENFTRVRPIQKLIAENRSLVRSYLSGAITDINILRKAGFNDRQITALAKEKIKRRQAFEKFK